MASWISVFSLEGGQSPPYRHCSVGSNIFKAQLGRNSPSGLFNILLIVGAIHGPRISDIVGTSVEQQRHLDRLSSNLKDVITIDYGWIESGREY